MNRDDNAPTAHDDTPAPGSVWWTGEHPLARQLTEREYHRDTATDPDAITPAIAEHAITALTRPGNVVLDPDCGAGTTLVEALRAGRHAIGITEQRHWWNLARTNVSAAKARGACVDGMVLPDRHRAEPAAPTGTVDLLLTALRATPTDAAPGRVGEADLDTVLAGIEALREALHTSRPLLRPGARVAITIAPRRDPYTGALHDLVGYVLAVGAGAGLAPTARSIALTAAVPGHRNAGRGERRRADLWARHYGHPIAVSTHRTVVIFRADPDAPDPALQLPRPPLPPVHARRRGDIQIADLRRILCSPTFAPASDPAETKPADPSDRQHHDPIDWGARSSQGELTLQPPDVLQRRRPAPLSVCDEREAA